ncbi:hypothetical protein MTR67_001426 [Solanum verrucosum]|uniref:Reverse transcriptase zinc-binding domain-containing protein n=1 Tax=Solanum verrucosum TaxID=315347 RepID=A0AAF0PNL9_SOLVR|nr:hypothetical protein MTR67_001426 [Solanum verrucosum]
MIQQILKAKQYLEEVGHELETVQQMEQFSIKAIYQSIIGPVNKGRLLTRDRLRKWGIDTSSVCPICLLEDETIQHLYLWNKLLAW